MKAMVIPAFGDPGIFEEREVPKPSPRPGEILVRIHATSVNPVDAKIRAAGSWAGIKPPAILGYDAAGVVEQTGDCVTDFSPGDEVYYTPEIFGNHGGTYAEYETVPAAIVAKKPRSLSFAEAAAVPLAGGTAWEAVMRRLHVRAGETILIHGGAGGVGSFATQIAKLAGARVIATAGPENQSTLRDLGADVALDYRSEDVGKRTLEVTGKAGVDAVFDTVGGQVLSQSLPLTRPFGRVATILAPEGDLLQAQLRNLTIHAIFLARERKRLDEMAAVLERRQIRPLVAHEWPLQRVGEAHRLLDSGHGRGKIVLTLR